MNVLVISDFPVIQQTAKSFIPSLNFVNNLDAMSTNQFQRTKLHSYAWQSRPDLIIFDLDSLQHSAKRQLEKLTLFMGSEGRLHETRVIVVSTQEQLRMLPPLDNKYGSPIVKPYNMSSILTRLRDYFVSEPLALRFT